VEYRQLGRTNGNVSVIGMGTWRFGMHNTSDEKVSQVRALRKGVELGMNLIDTAEMYALEFTGGRRSIRGTP
jgi:aryl-alcohol dehydrogenase-like predicted oxidoreductase